MSRKEHYNSYTQMEIASIDTELKDWFLTRRITMERNLSIKKALDDSNFSGLTNFAENLPAGEKILWGDLTRGKPQLEDKLSENGKKMKADMYLTMFRNSTDLNHVCRLPGSAYLRCLKENATGSISSSDRDMACASSFASFDMCRRGVAAQQEEALKKSIMVQDIGDQRAKAMFERRMILQDTLAC